MNGPTFLSDKLEIDQVGHFDAFWVEPFFFTITQIKEKRRLQKIAEPTR